MKRRIRNLITASTDIPAEDDFMIPIGLVFEFVKSIQLLQPYKITMEIHNGDTAEFVIGTGRYKITTPCDDYYI